MLTSTCMQNHAIQLPISLPPHDVHDDALEVMVYKADYQHIKLGSMHADRTLATYHVCPV